MFVGVIIASAAVSALCLGGWYAANCIAP